MAIDLPHMGFLQKDAAGYRVRAQRMAWFSPMLLTWSRPGKWLSF